MASRETKRKKIDRKINSYARLVFSCLTRNSLVPLSKQVYKRQKIINHIFIELSYLSFFLPYTTMTLSVDEDRTLRAASPAVSHASSHLHSDYNPSRKRHGHGGADEAPLMYGSRRRDTVVQQDEVFIDSERHNRAKKAKTFGDKVDDFFAYLYNSEYKEFLSRDALGWCKLSVFYTVFYACLAGFFIILLLIFFSTIDPKQPTYYNKASIMDYDGVNPNPGVGFRPQPDPESELIIFSDTDYKTMFNQLDLFLQKYEDQKNQTFTGAHGRKVTFDIGAILNGTPCSRDKFYGYSSRTPCVALKLNRIFGWLPITASSYPFDVSEPKGNKDKFVFVHCDGEHSADKDNIGEVEYYSSYPSKQVGGINFKYFPYRNQPGYLSPLVFAHFKSAAHNTLINVECKAYAKNIDHTNRFQRRGLAKFQLYIINKEKAKNNEATSSTTIQLAETAENSNP